MSESHDTSIDINKLATSLRGEFQKLYPLSDQCCIYRVPSSLRQLNEGDYTPKVVSIGPLHHGRAEFKVMEEHKKRYLQSFLERPEVRSKVSMEDLLKFIAVNETRLRNSYAETIELGSDDFVKMILLDAVFLVELLLRYSTHGFTIRDDRIFTKPQLRFEIEKDLFLLENQLPMFILKGLFKLSKPALPPYEAEYSFMEHTRNFWRYTCEQLLIEDYLLETRFFEATHFVDLLRLCLRPLEMCKQKKLEHLTTPTTTELHQAGVKFESASSNNLLDIKFENGILKIPKLKIIENRTENLFRNLLQFEGLHAETNYVNDYVAIMDFLINSPNDVELLVKNGIVENWLGNSEEVVTLFHNLGKECNIYDSNFCYTSLVADLNAHCKNPWHKWKATLKQDYFNTPWATISVIAAVILLLLTFLQTIFSAR